ncbi:unnamed protein product [Ixodes hexagonus]
MIDYVSQNEGRQSFRRNFGEGIDAGGWPEKTYKPEVTKQEEDLLHPYLPKRGPGWDFYSPGRSTARTNEEELKEHEFYSPDIPSADYIRKLVDASMPSTSLYPLLQNSDDVGRPVSNSVSSNATSNTAENSTANATANAAADLTVNATGTNATGHAAGNGPANATVNAIGARAGNGTVNATVQSLLNIALNVTSQTERESTHFKGFDKLDVVSISADPRAASNGSGTGFTVLPDSTETAAAKTSSFSEANPTTKESSEARRYFEEPSRKDATAGDHTPSASTRDVTIDQVTSSSPGDSSTSTTKVTNATSTVLPTTITSGVTYPTEFATASIFRFAKRVKAAPTISAQRPTKDITPSSTNTSTWAKRIARSTTDNNRSTNSPNNPVFGVRNQTQSTTETARSTTEPPTESTLPPTASTKQPAASSTTATGSSQQTTERTRVTRESTTLSTADTTRSPRATSSTESTKEPDETDKSKGEDEAHFPAKRIQRPGNSTTTRRPGIFDLFGGLASKEIHVRRARKTMRHVKPSPVPRAAQFTLFHAKPLNAIRIAVRRDKHGLS